MGIFTAGNSPATSTVTEDWKLPVFRWVLNIALMTSMGINAAMWTINSLNTPDSLSPQAAAIIQHNKNNHFQGLVIAGILFLVTDNMFKKVSDFNRRCKKQ